jgi:site-specific recombinase XerD
MVRRSAWMLDALLRAYEQHQQRTRGLTSRTLRNYGIILRLFLHSVLGEDPIDVTRLTPGDVVQFAASVRGRFSPATMKTVATSLRSFLRFLRVTELCSVPLEGAIPAVARWRLSSLPRCLNDEQHDQLILRSRGEWDPPWKRPRKVHGPPPSTPRSRDPEHDHLPDDWPEGVDPPHPESDIDPPIEDGWGG